jgi:5-hydroxyisourate hydrolase
MTGELTTHVLDTAHGCPAAGMRIDLVLIQPDGARQTLATATTNSDGRTDAALLAGSAMKPGRYELCFYIAAYFRASGVGFPEPPFLDVVPVRFAISDPATHYHVPLLVSPWSYTTYRGG